jgi:inorganic pyrophosphatase
MSFPYDFGYLPDTKADDGDPLDFLVLNGRADLSRMRNCCAHSGCHSSYPKRGRRENRNDRIVAVAEQTVRYAGVKQLSDLEPVLLKQIEQFFINYQKVRDVEFKVLGHGGPDAALQSIRKSGLKKAA